jgi:predicted AAA+ superfamily ATPase
LGGDSVIQIKTPFDGGKTHSLIAIMHEARDWNATPVVIVGTTLEGKTRLWEFIEKQLTGKIELLKDPTSPGKNKLRELLGQHQPLVILIDELLEYITKAAGVKVGESTIANQTFAFI